MLFKMIILTRQKVYSKETIFNPKIWIKNAKNRLMVSSTLKKMI